MNHTLRIMLYELFVYRQRKLDHWMSQTRLTRLDRSSRSRDQPERWIEPGCRLRRRLEMIFVGPNSGTQETDWFRFETLEPKVDCSLCLVHTMNFIQSFRAARAPTSCEPQHDERSKIKFHHYANLVWFRNITHHRIPARFHEVPASPKFGQVFREESNLFKKDSHWESWEMMETGKCFFIYE